jgi:hypothetical protein
MLNENKIDGERYDQKPIVVGKLRSHDNQTWIELLAAWPALDDQPTTMRLWIEQNSQTSPVTTFTLANGRSTFYDAWQLPSGFTDLRARDIRLQFTDQSGQTRTWTGDWRIVPQQPRTGP